MPQRESSDTRKASNGVEEEEVESPTDFHDECPRLTEEQLQRSTSEVYKARHLASDKAKNDISNFAGKYKHLRTRLDYSYHTVLTKSRQLLHDSLIDVIISQRSEECKACHSDTSRPAVLFTAGAMASGKGHTLRHCLKNGQVSLPDDFIWVDPDRISRHLPEREQYLKYGQDSAPERLHQEASMIQEILMLIARENKRSLVVDGSLSDGDWYKHVMADFREEGYSIEIFFVFADLPIMEKRAKQREKSTGRQTDLDQIRRTAKSAPESVRQLAHKDYVDRVRLLDNSSNDKPPHLVYDSANDTAFEQDGYTVDVMKWIKKELAFSEHPKESAKM